MTSLVLSQQNAIEPAPPVDRGFDELVGLTLQTLNSDGSKRVYAQTLGAWHAWCVDNEHEAIDLEPGTVLVFLGAQDTTKATRQRQLAALRKLAQVLYVLYPNDNTRRMMEGLKLVKAPRGTGGQERTRRALQPSAADKLLRAWPGNTARDLRNRALVAVLLLGGVRRAEGAALRWADIDFENGVIHIRHGKGDKARDVPLAGDYAIEALQAWQKAADCADCTHAREWVFCPINKGGHPGTDAPITGTAVYQIVEATGKAAGVEWKPHDARRTFITEGLATGTSLPIMQAIAGHADGSTTMGYAQAVDARKARKELRLRYG
jgi:integrase